MNALRIYLFILFLFLCVNSFVLAQTENDSTTTNPAVSPSNASETPEQSTRLIDVHKAWDLYNPPTFEPTSWRPELPAPAQLENALLIDRNMIVQLRLGDEIHRLKERIIQDSTDLQSLNGLGVIYAENGFFEQGKQWFVRALEIDSSFCPAHTNLGNVFYEKQELESAKKQYLTTLQFCPNSAETYFNLSLVEYGLGNLEEYQTCYDKYQQLDNALDKLNITPAVAAPEQGVSKKAAEAEKPHPLWIK